MLSPDRSMTSKPGGIVAPPDLVAAAQALQDNDLVKAEALVRARLKSQPANVEALKLLARIAAKSGFAADAEQLLRKVIALAPTFLEAHIDLTSLLCRLERAEEAVALVDLAIAKLPGIIWPLSLKAAILDAERRTEESLVLHEELVRRAPRAAIPWLNYGQALKAVGRVVDAAAAYRKSLQIDSANGFAWLGLASLRTVKLGANDVAQIEHALSRTNDGLQRVQLHFALGRALGDQGVFKQSFRHYEEGNRGRQKLTPYDAGATSDLVRQVVATFDTGFLAGHEGQGCDAPDPIFIIGMPRSGSTLIEQILASHPMIEGCGELFELNNLVARLTGGDVAPQAWLEAVAELDADERGALGKRYLASVQRHRRTDRPFFTDKMPSNWRYIGLIHLILPNARIIDIRRHPMACCFSAFTTYFNRETSFPTNLDDLGRFYADYVRMIAHFEAVQPGKIHHILYESLVTDLEREIRGLLDYLGLPFDVACLRFHENLRPIHTPSAQQVRRPINGEGLEFWRNYEPWLAPLRGK